MKITEIIETFIKEGYVASSIEASGGESRVIITLLRKDNFTVAISHDKCGNVFYVAEEDGTPVSFHKYFLEIEKWKGNSYEMKIDEVFQPSEVLALLADVPHYSQISILDFIILLSQK